jgi:uncharacterized membrane protein YeaQ/YmgE (transglycosylase-associated protein family)
VELVRLVLLGLAVGVVARLATHGRGGKGVRAGLVLGALGAVVGGLVATSAGVRGNAYWLVAVVGALAFLYGERVLAALTALGMLVTSRFVRDE